MPQPVRPHPFLLALTYVGLVFALGFVLGAMRTLWLAPRIGAAPAVLVEQVPMLAASWLTARALLRRWPLKSRGQAAAMGALAFAVLMALECALAVLLFGETPRRWAAALATLPGLLGLAGQALFAAMPWAVWRGAWPQFVAPT